PLTTRDSPLTSSQHSLIRAWFYLVWLCVQRQARLRQMVGIALALLLLMATLVALNTLAGRWGMDKWWLRWFPPPAQPADSSPAMTSAAKAGATPSSPKVETPPKVMTQTYGETANLLEKEPLVGRWSPGTGAAATVQDAVALAFRNALGRSP